MRCCAIAGKEKVASNSPFTERESEASWRVTDGQGTAGRGQRGGDSRGAARDPGRIAAGTEPVSGRITMGTDGAPGPAKGKE